VLSLYARGLSTREIQGHLEELYGTEVSPTLIPGVSSKVCNFFTPVLAPQTESQTD
jgi:transposase-like protein